MHLYLQVTRSLAVTLIWLYCNKLVLLGQVSIPQPGIVTVNNNTPSQHKSTKCCEDLEFWLYLLNVV